ncbi:MAG: tartrate dehydrogenase [Acidobacteria bacterium]|nr:MAG: tartrate dehydrogenase [Acidobacteriota bacterium]PYX44789.1 MAG: tartrate dehydrogenase [Acidobacteriota bacterium]
MKAYKIAVIEGDGIGREVVPEGVRVLEAVAHRFDLSFSWQNFDWSCERYAKTGRMMPEDGLEQLRPFDAIYLGAIGYPGVPDHVSLWGLLIPIRRGFKQYVNLRPVRLLEGITSPLSGRKPGEIDFVIVRENSEGEYSEVGGRLNRNTEDDIAIQQSIFTRRACDRIIRYACELARTRKKHVTSATKSNGIVFSMPFWDERFAAISKQYPDVKADQFHIDILSAHLVAHPDWFDVVVGSNLFGDILSDLGAAVVGSMGLAPAANLNPEREYPSLFEPVHGSAPDIAGKGIANPVAQIWTGAMMLRHLGEEQAAHAVEQAIFKVLASSSVRTRDIGGKASTRQMGEVIAEEVSASAGVSAR